MRVRSAGKIVAGVDDGVLGIGKVVHDDVAQWRQSFSEELTTAITS